MKSLQCIILCFMVIQGLDGCEPDWVSYRQFCYLFSTTTETQANANATCFGKEAALAKIEDHNDIDFVTMETNTSDTLKLRKYFIRGLCLDGVTFTIQTGVPLKYTHWKPNEPNRLYEQKCIVLVLKSSSYDLTERQMASQYCTRTYYYICKKPSETITTTLPIDTSATSTDIAKETTLSKTNIFIKLDTTVSDAPRTSTAATTSSTSTSAVPNTSTAASTAMTPVSEASAFPSTRATDTPFTSTTASTAIISGSDISAHSSTPTADAPITSAAASSAVTSGSSTNATTALIVTSDSSTSTLSTDASVADISPAIVTSPNPSIIPETNNGFMSETTFSTDDPISSTNETVRIANTTETSSGTSTSSTQIPIAVEPTKRVVILESVDFVPVVKEANGSAIIGVLGIVIICTILFCIVCSDVGVIRRNFKYLKESLSIV